MFFIIVYAVILIIVWGTVILSIVRKKRSASLCIAEYLQLIALGLITGVLMLYSCKGSIGFPSVESFLLWAGLSLLIIILNIANTLLHLFRGRAGSTIPSAFFPSALLLVTGIIMKYILLVLLIAFYFAFALWSDRRKPNVH